MPEMEVGSNKRVSDYTYESDQIKKPRSDTMKMRLLLLGRYCGLVIGKGGENLSRLRKEYNVNLEMPASQTHDRVFTVEGEPDSCLGVVKEILPSCHQAPYPVGQKSSFEVDLLVATEIVGMLIGKGGEKLKEIRDQSNARIKVYQECLPESNERVVAVAGDAEEDVLGGVKMILQMLSTARRVPFHPYDPHNRPSEILGSGITGSGIIGSGLSTGLLPGMASQSMQQIGNQQLMGMDNPFAKLHTVSCITVPNDICGAIIGKAGVRINEVRHTSGASIEFSETNDGTERTRIVTITGTQQQVNLAEQLMAECARNRTK